MTPLVALACAGAGLVSGLLVAGTILGAAHWHDAHQRRRQLPATVGGWRAVTLHPTSPHKQPPTRSPS